MTTSIAIAPGCPAGIGPEVTAQAMASLSSTSTAFVYCGSVALLKEGCRRAGVDARVEGHTVHVGAHAIRCVDDDNGATSNAGVVDESALEIQRDGLLRAISLAERGEVDAIVTAPIRKASLTGLAGGPFPGQTELLHHHLATDDKGALMVFEGGPFLLGLATVHVPLADVPSALTIDVVVDAVKRLDADVRLSRVSSSKNGSPVIALLGVNPHAGENGLLGSDEHRVLAPAIARLKNEGVVVTGPFPADGFFARYAHPVEGGPDAVLAMFHDQGLPAYKLLAKGAGVNVTLGLRVPRTSPDHGTADDIAGRSLARSTSMLAALQSAIRRVGGSLTSI